MTVTIREVVHGFVFALGMVLIIGGLVAGTPGAYIVGLIVAAVNFNRWQKWHKQRPPVNRL